MAVLVHHPGYTAATPADHRFPMGKFAALARRLQAEGLAPDGFAAPQPAPREALIRAHDPAYVDAVLAGTLSPAQVRRIGFPMVASVVLRGRLATGGTLLAARHALLSGLACNTAGGSHHASRAGGAGFCVFNDVAVASLALLAEGRVSRILVVDCDVHHGDGTARIFAGDPRVFTLSLHCADNWPLEKPASDLDVALPAGTGDAVYLDALDAALTEALHRHWPDLVFYIAGVDVHGDDRLGRLKLTDAGIAARERLVLGHCRGLGLPVCGVLGGGYQSDPERLADLHAHLFRAAHALDATAHPLPGLLAGTGTAS